MTHVRPQNSTTEVTLKKRKRYDNHGVVDDQDRRGNHPENFRHHFRSGSPFDSFFDEGFGGGFGGRGKFCSLNFYLPKAELLIDNELQ